MLEDGGFKRNQEVSITGVWYAVAEHCSGSYCLPHHNSTPTALALGTKSVLS